METGEPGPLFRVRDLQKGDEIFLYSENTKYTHRVDRYQYIPDTWMEYLKNRPDPVQHPVQRLFLPFHQEIPFSLHFPSRQDYVI